MHEREKTESHKMLRLQLILALMKFNSFNAPFIKKGYLISIVHKQETRKSISIKIKETLKQTSKKMATCYVQKWS